VLETAGFGNSKKLAAQFYFKDLTVFKVMFTAIIVAMVLVFLATGLGLLDYNLIWVNPTYLWPGIVGGLIMGVGFIVGGFCPGTSLVALATANSTACSSCSACWPASSCSARRWPAVRGCSSQLWVYMGRFTLPELFGVELRYGAWSSSGVVLMALFMFWGSTTGLPLLGRRMGASSRQRAPGKSGCAIISPAPLGPTIRLRARMPTATIWNSRPGSSWICSVARQKVAVGSQMIASVGTCVHKKHRS
jgi:hypothetical protein